MMLKEENFKIAQRDNGFELRILMPDGSNNYLHGLTELDINDALVTRDTLMGNTFYEHDISIEYSDKYFRIQLLLRGPNDELYPFHSRKLNLNDIVYERMQLCVSDE